MKKTFALALALALLCAHTAFALTLPVAVSFSTAVAVEKLTVLQLQGSDADGTPLTYTKLSDPAHGSISQFSSATGALVYTPAAGYTGADSFTYKVTSGGEDSPTATVSITVTAAKTRIIDTLTNPDGTPRQGKASFVLTQASSSPSGLIPAKASVTCVLTNTGQCDVSLYPSSAINPLQWYQVYYFDANGNSQLLGILNVPASTTTITFGGHWITDMNLVAQRAFASKAEVDALTQAVSQATLASLNSSQVVSALGYTPANSATLGTMASQNANNVNITGGTVNGITCVGCTNIGTGSSGGVANTGNTVIAAGTGGGPGRISVQTHGGVERIGVEDDGTVKIAGQAVSFPINVLTYGPDRTGATDSASAFTSAINNCNTAGGCTLYVPIGTFKLTSALPALTVPFKVKGDGRHLTTINYTQPTGTPFTSQAMNGEFRDFTLDNVSGTTPSSGAGIVITHPSSAANRVDLYSVFIFGFYDDLDIQSGNAWIFADGGIGDPVRYGAHIRNINNADAGDWVMDRVQFSQGRYLSDVAIRQESSGGGRISNVKINGISGDGVQPSFNGGIYIDFTGTDTGIIKIDDQTSIENTRGIGIYINHGTQVDIGTVQFGMYGNTGASAVYLDNSSEARVGSIRARQPSGAGFPLITVHNGSCTDPAQPTGRFFNPWVSYTGTYTPNCYEFSNGLTPLAYSGSWANLGGGFVPGTYEFRGGMVNVRLVAAGGITSIPPGGSTIAVLPLGARPSGTIPVSCLGNGAPAECTVDATGVIKIVAGDPTNSVSMNFSFRPL
jgi:hypothetical protein